MARDNCASRLAELESRIETNQRGFYVIGKALKEIKTGQLYGRGGFDNFKGYLKKRWDMSRSYAYRLIDASMVIDNLSAIGERLPTREAQARPLARLDKIDQCKVWREFLKSGMEQKTRNIQKFISAYMDVRNTRTSSSRVEIIGENYKAAVDALMYQIRIAHNDRWESTSREAALYWNKVMKEKIVWKTLLSIRKPKRGR